MNTDVSDEPYRPPRSNLDRGETVPVDSLDGLPTSRSGCLTALLVMMFIANPVTALVYFFGGSWLTNAVPGMPEWLLPFLGAGCLLNVLFAAAVWHWYKWGVYGFAGVAVIALAINFVYLGAQSAVSGLVGPIMLVLLLRPVWHRMR